MWENLELFAGGFEGPCLAVSQGSLNADGMVADSPFRPQHSAVMEIGSYEALEIQVKFAAFANSSIIRGLMDKPTDQTGDRLKGGETGTHSSPDASIATTMAGFTRVGWREGGTQQPIVPAKSWVLYANRYTLNVIEGR